MGKIDKIVFYTSVNFLKRGVFFMLEEVLKFTFFFRFVYMVTILIGYIYIYRIFIFVYFSVRLFLVNVPGLLLVYIF